MECSILYQVLVKIENFDCHISDSYGLDFSFIQEFNAFISSLFNRKEKEQTEELNSKNKFVHISLQRAKKNCFANKLSVENVKNPTRLKRNTTKESHYRAV